MCIIPAYEAFTSDLANTITPTGADPRKKNALALCPSFWPIGADRYACHHPDVWEVVTSCNPLSGGQHPASVGSSGEDQLVVGVDWCMSHYRDLTGATLHGPVSSVSEHHNDSGRIGEHLPCGPEMDCGRHGGCSLHSDDRTVVDGESCLDPSVLAGHLNGLTLRAVDADRGWGAVDE